ncbi:hypothetical protein [Actinoplanes sp. NPDC051859]|uniref:hypothetical protein n=1 Tax=Actinoplanes sp. NPDC051859 TaxID=3363909 RepID=UPI00378D3565
MTTSGEPRRPFQLQQNTGPGTFINGDNHGTIEMVDAKTKSVLDKISKEAPRLGDLLKTALRDGVISPHIALSLSEAAYNINHRTAEMLYEASLSINHRTAELIYEASLSINPGAAQQIYDASKVLTSDLGDRVSNAASIFASHPQQLRDANDEMRQVLAGIQTLAEVVDRAPIFERSAQAVLGATENLAMASSRVRPRPRSGSFLWGFFLGALLVVVALGFHAYSTRVV